MCIEHICIRVRYRKQQSETECGVWSLEVDWWAGWEMESVSLQLLQDRGKQSGSGNPLSQTLGQKEGISADLEGIQTKPSADTEASWSPECDHQTVAAVYPRDPQWGPQIGTILPSDVDGHTKGGNLPGSIHHFHRQAILSTYIMRLRCKVYPSSEPRKVRLQKMNKPAPVRDQKKPQSQYSHSKLSASKTYVWNSWPM